MTMSMCPQCGGKLKDIRGEQTETDAATRTEWFCCGLENHDCGVRGHYDECDRPVAKEDSDATRLNRMYGRVIDALTATSDRRLARCLADRHTLLRLMERDIGWVEDKGGKQFWCDDHGLFEEEMQNAENDLASPDLSSYEGGNHLLTDDPETCRKLAMDTLMRAGLVDQDGDPTPPYAPGNDDHAPHAFGSDTDAAGG